MGGNLSNFNRVGKGLVLRHDNQFVPWRSVIKRHLGQFQPHSAEACSRRRQLSGIQQMLPLFTKPHRNRIQAVAPAGRPRAFPTPFGTSNIRVGRELYRKTCPR